MKGSSVIISMLLVIALVQLMAKSGQAVTCGQVDASLASCIPYLTSGGNPPAACCDGVKNIKAITPTTADRKAACNCVKAAAARYPNIKPDAASSLPQKCGVEMTIPISQATNCDKYKLASTFRDSYLQLVFMCLYFILTNAKACP